MKTLIQLNESEISSQDANTYHKVISDSFRRVKSAGNVKRIRDLKEIEQLTTDVSVKGVLTFLAHIDAVLCNFTIDYTLSRTDVFSYELYVSKNGSPVLSDIYELELIDGIDLQNQIIHRTDTTLRRI